MFNGPAMDNSYNALANGAVTRRLYLDDVCRAPAGRGRDVAGLPERGGRVLRAQLAAGLQELPRRQRRQRADGLAHAHAAPAGAVRERHQDARPRPAQGGRDGRYAAPGVVDLRDVVGLRAPERVEPGAGRGLHRPGAGRADREPRRVEQDGAVPQLRRERRLLRPHGAAGAAVVRDAGTPIPRRRCSPAPARSTRPTSTWATPTAASPASTRTGTTRSASARACRCT